jgi:hypothetical protein
MGELFPITIDDLIEEARREAIMRRSVYDRQVSARRMSVSSADRKINLMEAIGAVLRAVRDKGLADQLVPRAVRHCACCQRGDPGHHEPPGNWPRPNFCSGCGA